MVLDTFTWLNQQEVEVQHGSMALASPGIRLTPSASSALTASMETSANYRQEYRSIMIRHNVETTK